MRCTHNKLQNIILLLFGAFCGIFLTEVILRIVFPSHINILKLNEYAESERGKFCRYDSYLGWDGLERGEGDFEWFDCRYHVRQNRFGYRGSEFDFSRSKKKRLVVLGDSFAWGFGVNDNDIFTSIMEQRSNGSLEVVNLGVSGYGTDQEYLLWNKKGYLWKPDDVIITIVLDNDLQDISSDMRYGYSKPVFRLVNNDLVLANEPVPPRTAFWQEPIPVLPGTTSWQEPGQKVGEKSKWISRVLSHSHLASLLISSFSKYECTRHYLESRHIILQRSVVTETMMTYAEPPDQEMSHAWEILFKLLEKLNSAVTNNGARLSVVIVPSIVQVYPELWDRLKKEEAFPERVKFDLEFPNRHILSWCQKRRIMVIDLLPSLRAAAKWNPYLYFPLNNHWTPAGHEIVAATILDKLKFSR